jgi:hypothetical protein
MAKGRRGLDGRHRDKGGRIEKKHGSTRVGSLRKEYGEDFAKGHRKDLMLKTLLKDTGSTSLRDYLKHSKRGARWKTGAIDISLDSSTAISRTTELFRPALKSLAKK